MDTVALLGPKYRPRVLDASLAEAHKSVGAVVIEGARATGKTMTGLNAASSFAFVDDPETQLVIAVAPRSVLDGSAPRLLDEWQLSPELWNLVNEPI